MGYLARYGIFGNFIKNLSVIKDNMFPVPPLFRAIQRESKTEWREMYKVFNMGHRMEIYTTPESVERIISISEKFGIEARVIGRVEASDETETTIISQYGTFRYVK